MDTVRNPLSENADHAAALAVVFSHRPNDAPFGKPLDGVELLRGVFTSPPGTPLADLSRFRRLTQALGAGKRELTVLVLGGSMTAGHMKGLVNIHESSCLANVSDLSEVPCAAVTGTAPNKNVDHLDCHPCAFPARLGTWLSGAYPHAMVRIMNEAVGSLHSMACEGMLGGLLAEVGDDVDLVILNFAPNDSKIVGSMVRLAPNCNSPRLRALLAAQPLASLPPAR